MSSHEHPLSPLKFQGPQIDQNLHPLSHNARAIGLVRAHEWTRGRNTTATNFSRPQHLLVALAGERWSLVQIAHAAREGEERGKEDESLACRLVWHACT